MSQAIVIDQFEGPLGLLLELVERNKMSVTDIAVATITSQYTERIAGMTDLAPEELSEFVQLGARLAYIKSLALLPTTQPDEQTDELRRLGEELAEYRRYQAAARTLAAAAHRPSFRRPRAQMLPAGELPLPQIPLSELTAVFNAAIKRLEPAKPRRTLSTQLSQADVVTKLKHRLVAGGFELSQLLDSMHDRLEVVVTFAALLELIRSGQAVVVQDGQFGPILVEAAGD